MRRDDLPPGYDGWQAVDSPSTGGPTDSVGPVPVKAVLQKQVGKIWQGASQYFLSELLSEVKKWEWFVGVVVNGTLPFLTRSVSTELSTHMRT